MFDFSFIYTCKCGYLGGASMAGAICPRCHSQVHCPFVPHPHLFTPHSPVHAPFVYDEDLDCKKDIISIVLAQGSKKQIEMEYGYYCFRVKEKVFQKLSDHEHPVFHILNAWIEPILKDNTIEYQLLTGIVVSCRSPRYIAVSRRSPRYEEISFEDRGNEALSVLNVLDYKPSTEDLHIFSEVQTGCWSNKISYKELITNFIDNHVLYHRAVRVMFLSTDSIIGRYIYYSTSHAVSGKLVAHCPIVGNKFSDCNFDPLDPDRPITIVHIPVNN